MTPNANNHERVIVGIFTSMQGTWIDGSILRDNTNTSSLPARISALRAKGYVIESRPPIHDGDFYQYKFVERTEPRGRRQLLSKLPPCPAGRAYSLEELEGIQKASDEAIARYVESIKPVTVEVDWFGDLMSRL